MDIRNFKRNKLKKKKFFMTIVVILIVIFLFYKIKHFLAAPAQEEVWTWEVFSGQQVGSYKKWDRIRFAGSLSVDNHFPLYTHTIIRGADVIGVKSTSINLNNYVWNLEIVGEIIDFDKNLPIVDVAIVKLAKPWLIIKWNSYLFVKDLLLFDFTDQPQLSADKSGKNITINFNKELVFNVERFLCSKILQDKDCNYIIESYLSSQKEFFNTEAWYTFYKHATKTWAVFDGNIFGYMFKNIEDDTILDISNMVKIVNKDFVVQNKKDIIKEKCRNADDALKTIEFSKVGFNDPYFLMATVEGTTKNKKQFTCNITFDLWDEWTPTDVNFKIQ